MSSSSSIRLF
uniref:Uncharacterized protein n=1 Tax=Arundo donax TaxID=35708 RepID=A0A0A8Z901_ARUDO